MILFFLGFLKIPSVQANIKNENTDFTTDETSSELTTQTKENQMVVDTQESVVTGNTETTDAADATEAAEAGTEAPAEETAYTYTDSSATMYAKGKVNLRDIPDKTGNKVGSLSTNDEVTVTGKCNETGWYRIEYNGGVAYVSNSYLVSEKVEVAPPAETPSNGGNNSGTPICYSWPSDTIVYENGMGFICGEINRHNTALYQSLEAKMRAKYPEEASTPRHWYGNGYAFQLADGRWYYPVGPYYLCPNTSVYKESVRLFGN